MITLLCIASHINFSQRFFSDVHINKVRQRWSDDKYFWKHLFTTCNWLGYGRITETKFRFELMFLVLLSFGYFMLLSSNRVIDLL